ncbi:thiaminase II [Granulosicoccus sp. 3-233]|uniref:thiaminase II n=1 Tax=Granulosicoccus sp. 3-233 TaxID=3417969 RepID=UPI003D33382A
MSQQTLTQHLIAHSEPHWQHYIQHEFVRQLAAGTLPAECFEHYLKQDYLFLIQFARAFGLAAYKSRSLAELKQAQSSLHGIIDIELDLHIGYCQQFGISKQALEETVESTPNMAYTRYVLERGMAGDLLDLNVALAPCIIGYAEVANWLQTQSFLVTEGNPYSDWVQMYASEEYQQVANTHRQACDAISMEQLGEPRVQALCRTFDAATRLEVDFWQMGLDCR